VAKTATGPEFEAAAESAVRAVRQCMPLKLPADKYEWWKDVEATFDPRMICNDGGQHCRNSDSTR